MAGLQVPDARVLDLARQLEAAGFDDPADRLDGAWRREIRVFALEVADREASVRVPEDGPEEFGELRATLLQEHVRR